MGATAIDTLPGGLLDLLMAADPLGAGQPDLRSGRALAAARAVEGHAEWPTAAAWCHLARHSALLALPEGGALPMVDPLDQRPAPPAGPGLPNPGSPSSRSAG
jgi:hypothetical protein